MKKLNLAICQMKVGIDKNENLNNAEKMIGKAAGQGADVIVLPEIFNAPYEAKLFPAYAELYPGPSTDFLAATAQKFGICLVGGSIIEKDYAGRIYNSSFVFDDQGTLLARHRKIHLFDIALPGRITFRESDTLSAGNTLSIFKYKSLCFGLMICYDCRFPELARAAVLEGARILIVPAAFNLTTGPAHWELLMRSRAVDNQVFLAAASPARNTDSSYLAWGHSMVVDPWGTIILEAGIDEDIIFAELDFAVLEKVRNELPLLKQRRTDIYNLKYKKSSLE
ncbi:MAG: carbon-nitrogen hydrolase family protein [Syntrophomonadaceae bacterium]|nr:carbon-nitrogen hydrolase family protein [Syntrophomonadaceae bacterium]